jgi:hypothetical protein
VESATVAFSLVAVSEVVETSFVDVTAIAGVSLAETFAATGASAAAMTATGAAATVVEASTVEARAVGALSVEAAATGAAETSFVEAAAVGASLVTVSEAGDWFVAVSAAELKLVEVPFVESPYAVTAATIALIVLVETVPVELVADSPGCTAAAPEFASFNCFPGVAGVALGNVLLLAHPETKLAARAAHNPKKIEVLVERPSRLALVEIICWPLS